MLDLMQARFPVRAASRTVALTVALAAGVGGAVVTAGLIDDGASRSRAERLADAAAHGFSESALRAQSGGMSPSTLTIAERFDPYAAPDDAGAVFAARLQRRQATPVRAAPSVPAAEPFRTGGALSSARELECLSQAVYYEARGEGSSGQAAVAQVVLNRVRHPAFPKSVCGVVFQGASAGRCQFSFACDGSIRRTRETGAWRRAQRIAVSALSGQVAADVGNATHFHATAVSPGWGGMVRVAAVGQHIFYRFGGRNGAPGSFKSRYRPDSEPKAVYASMLPTPLLPAAKLPDTLAPTSSTRHAPTAAPAPAAMVAAPEHGQDGVAAPAPAPAEVSPAA